MYKYICVTLNHIMYTRMMLILIAFESLLKPETNCVSNSLIIFRAVIRYIIISPSSEVDPSFLSLQSCVAAEQQQQQQPYSMALLHHSAKKQQSSITTAFPPPQTHTLTQCDVYITHNITPPPLPTIGTHITWVALRAYAYR